MTKYPTEEALRLMAAAAEELTPDEGEHLKAAEELLGTMGRELDEQHGFRFYVGRSGPLSVDITLPHKKNECSETVSLRYEEGEFRLIATGKQPKTVKLSYDRFDQKFVGPKNTETGERLPALTAIVRDLIKVSKRPTEETSDFYR